jgi:hypothetical protein
MTMRLKLLATVAASLLSTAALACPTKTICTAEWESPDPGGHNAMATTKQFSEADWACLDAYDPKTQKRQLWSCLKGNGWTTQ